MKDYFYIDYQNQQHGPLSADKLLAVGVKRDTLVWCKGMPDWTPAEAVAELKTIFDAADQQTAQAQQSPNASQQTASPNEPPRRPQPGSYQQSYAYQDYNRPPFPDSHMVWAVLSTICCCLPLGIVAIIKANEVSGLYYRGLYDEAYLAAEDAKKWSLAALIVGLLSCFGGSIFNVFGLFGSMNTLLYDWPLYL